MGMFRVMKVWIKWAALVLAGLILVPSCGWFQRRDRSVDCWEVQKGFRSIPWGTPLAEVTDLIPVDPYAKIKIYKRKGDACLFENRVVDQIYYGFCPDRLCAAAMAFSDRAVGLKLKQMMSSKYGPPDRTESLGPEEQVLTWVRHQLEIILELKPDGALKYRYYRK